MSFAPHNAARERIRRRTARASRAMRARDDARVGIGAMRARCGVRRDDDGAGDGDGGDKGDDDASVVNVNNDFIGASVFGVRRATRRAMR